MCPVCRGALPGTRHPAGLPPAGCQRTKQCVRLSPNYFTTAERLAAALTLEEFRETVAERHARKAREDGLIKSINSLPAPADPMVQLTIEDRARHGSWMQTHTGVSFYPLDPRAADINIEDVAHGLAMCCRYAGQCARYYSVAEHCVLVSMHVHPAYAREGLLHDLSEAYLGDMIRPLKHTPEMEPFRKAEAAIEYQASVAFNLNTSSDCAANVKHVDDRILIDEIKQLQHTPSAYLMRMDTRNKPPLGVKLKCWSPARAKRRFLARFAELFGVKVPWYKRLWWRYG